ncbi:hypothetical protein [Flavobacterium sp.]|uniref:hypothetical protein n=1 Tax=Flavobacterium sp. TaxID=239 RepID=UPI002FD8F11C
MNNEKEIIDDLVVGGIIGASLGALISNDKGKGATIGAIAGAALFATFNAHESAKKENLTLVYEENGVIYEEHNGKRRVLKNLERLNIVPKKSYKLK